MIKHDATASFAKSTGVNKYSHDWNLFLLSVPGEY